MILRVSFSVDLFGNIDCNAQSMSHNVATIVITILNYFFYFPMQKLEKTLPNKSSELNAPVISLKYC